MDSDLKVVSKSAKHVDKLIHYSSKTHSGEKLSPIHVSRKDVFDNLNRKNTINIDQLSPDTIKFLSPHSVDRLLAKKSIQLLAKEALISSQASPENWKEPSRSPSPIQGVKRRRRILNLDSSIEVSDGTPLYDENIQPMDLSTSSQQDMFQESQSQPSHISHIPVRDIPLPESGLPPMSSTQTSHSVIRDVNMSHFSPLMKSAVDSTGYDSQCNIFGSQCSFSPTSQPTTKAKKRSFPYSVDAIETCTAAPQLTDFTCSPEFTTVSHLLSQETGISQSEVFTDQIVDKEYIVRLPKLGVLNAIRKDFLTDMRLSELGNTGVYPPQPLFINKVEPDMLPVNCSLEAPHQRYVSLVPHAYSVLLSDEARPHPQKNLVRLPATAINAMELSAIHATQIAIHQQRINNFVLENGASAHSELDILKQTVMNTCQSLPQESKTKLVDQIDSLASRVSTSNLATCVSASLDLPLLEHNVFIQSSCEVARRNKLLSDSPFHASLPPTSIKNMRFSSLGGNHLVAVTAVNEAVLDKQRRIYLSQIAEFQYSI